MIDVLTTVLVVVVLLFAAGWYLSYSAARLDRLHAKAEGSLSALDAQLVRRAEAGLELATSGSLDPASALLVADAATTALERHTTHPLGDDPLDGQHFGGLESVESDLTAALMAALTAESVATIREDQPESAGVEAWTGWRLRRCGCKWPADSTTRPCGRCGGCGPNASCGSSIWPVTPRCLSRWSSTMRCPRPDRAGAQLCCQRPIRGEISA